MTSTAKGARAQNKAQQIFISRTIPSHGIDADSKLITTDNVKVAASTVIDEATTKISVTIVSDADNAYSDAFTASELKTKLRVGNEFYNFASISQLDKSLMMSQYSRNADELKSSLKFTVDALISRIPSKMTLDDAKGLIESAAPAEIEIGGLSAAEYAVKSLETAVTSRNREIINSISIDPSNQNVEYMDVEYGPDLVEYIINNPGNYAFTGGLGTCKSSKGMMPIFNRLCEMIEYPMLCGAKQILIASMVSDDRHYQTARHLLNERATRAIPVGGVAGVVNLLLGTDEFKEINEEGTAFLIEEPEDVFSHSVGSAVGERGTLKERADLNDAIDKKMASVKWNVLADAMLSNETVNRIAAVTGKKIIICRPSNVEPHNLTVKYYASEDECVAVTNEALAAGKNVATFCDGSHNANRSRFNELHRSIAKDGVKSLVIDGESMSKTDAIDFIKNIDTELEKYQHAMISPVINSGVNIMTDHYDKTSVLGYQTQAPNQIIQSKRRLRKVDDIDLCISPIRRKYATSTYMILSNELHRELKDYEMTDEVFEEYLNDKSVMKVIDRISFENRMRQDYTNTVLVMLEFMGFNVELVAHNKDRKKKGREDISKGTAMEEEARRNAIKAAESIGDESANKIRNNKKFATQGAKYKLAAHEIRSFFEVKEIDDDLVEFDSHGFGRTIIRNMQYAREDIPVNISAEERIKRTTIHTVLGMLNINPSTFKGEYNEAQGKELLNWITAGSIKVGKKDVSAMVAIELTFSDASISTQQARVITSILSSGFCLDLLMIGRGKKKLGQSRDKRYKPVSTEYSQLAEGFYDHIVEVRNPKN